MFKRWLRRSKRAKNADHLHKQGAAEPEAPNHAVPVGSERAELDKDTSTPLDREPFGHEEVVQLIGRHAQKLADLANEHGCSTLYYFLRCAAEQAERELEAAQRQPE